ncbi:pre-mRNA 3'-end-processing factor FIP1 [Paramisgurnus dabryanus]|uniref:pre-mRNA 3'-end-processing factor FIP1 n=1 Tax=Paramisgurnus dabryanus TaxID=90735 RepID=UPI0031F3B677
MSTTEVQKTADESVDDETDWLYGEDNIADEETTEKEIFSALIGDVDGVNELNYQESESDSDDDVCVTIGDIKTGGSQSLSLGSSSISLNIKSLGSGCKSRVLEVDAEGNVLETDGEPFEEKPWRKPGADLSDYFNYGFNEDTWKTYCDKHRRLRMSLEILSLSSSDKITVHPSSSDLSEYASILTRKSSGSINVIGGQTGTISRVEGRRRHGADENNIQVVSEHSSDTELPSPKLLPFFPPNIPPPPFPPPSISTTPPLIPPPPPGYPLPPGASLSMISGHLGGGRSVPPFSDGRSISPYPFPPGVYPTAPSMASWPRVLNSGKPWDYYGHQKEREREKGHKKERERERYREGDQSPSSQDHRSEEERPSRHRDHTHYRRERYRESSAREGESDRRREKRQRERSEPHRSSRSGSSRRHHYSDDADSHRRHRHKRSRHKRESGEPSEECSVDQDNQSEVPE